MAFGGPSSGQKAFRRRGPASASAVLEQNKALRQAGCWVDLRRGYCKGDIDRAPFKGI